MKNPPKKKAGRVRSSTTRRRTKRVEPVALPARYRHLLAQARVWVGNADEYLDEIKNNLRRGETFEYRANVAGLRYTFGRMRRLYAFLKALEQHAQREVAV